jgi:glycosyltransferase involved in cell wall biosynthesis
VENDIERGVIEMEMISVIIPVFNVKDYLKDCIESVINNTYKNLEIIMIDDGSQDGSSEIIDEYAARDSRIKTIHKENTGVSSARNAGLDIATGDYISFVDSDDFIEPQMFENLLEILRKEDADIVQCGYEKVDENTQKRQKMFQSDKVFLSNKDVCEAYFVKSKLNLMLWNKLYKRKVIGDIRMVEGRNNEDNMFWIDIIRKINKAVTISAPHYKYRIRNNSIMHRDFAADKLDILYAYEYMYHQCESGMKEYQKYILIWMCLDCAYLYYEIWKSQFEDKENYYKLVVDCFNRNFKIVRENKYYRSYRINYIWASLFDRNKNFVKLYDREGYGI